MDSHETAKSSIVKELQACWRGMPYRWVFVLLFAAWCIFFHVLGNSTFGYVDTPSLFGWMHNAYNSPGSDDGHGNLIPIVVLVLLGWKRHELMAITKGVWGPALVLLAFATGCHLVGFLIQQPRVSVVAFFLGVYSIMGLCWGKAWLRTTFFPFVLFVFCIPIGSLAESITFPLRMLVTTISVGISEHGLGIDVVREGSRLMSPDQRFVYDVAPACSGIRSLISLLALTTIYGFVVFRSAWKRILMVAIALPLALAGNVARITSVIIAAEAFGQDVGAKVHDGAGFITFLLAIGCVIALGAWLREKPLSEVKENAIA
jgi:exosortase